MIIFASQQMDWLSDKGRKTNCPSYWIARINLTKLVGILITENTYHVPAGRSWKVYDIYTKICHEPAGTNLPQRLFHLTYIRIVYYFSLIIDFRAPGIFIFDKLLT